MKALLRYWNNEQFVYVDVEYKRKKFYIKETKELIEEHDIIDLSYDTRHKYVVCSHCGELVKNTENSIKAHIDRTAKFKNCFTCRRKMEFDATSSATTYKPDLRVPGRYVATARYNVDLRCSCNRSAGYPRINSEDADRHCVFYACKNATYNQIMDVFTEYPHMFDVLPTVDMLIAKRWKFSQTVGTSSCPYFSYEHPSMKSLHAYVNSKGIISHFSLTTNNRNCTFMYSKRYDKLFYIFGGKYNDSPLYDLSASRVESMYEKIKELF